MSRPSSRPREEQAAESAQTGRRRGLPGSVRRRQVPPVAAYLLVSLAICALGYWAARLLPDRVGAPYHTDIFFHQFMVHEGPGALLAAGLLVLAALLAAVVPERAIAGCVRYFTVRTGFVAAISFFVLAAGTLVVYENHPLAMDEYMATFQARIFAEGEIYGRFPPELIPRLIPPFFLNKTFIAASLTSGKVLSTYLPGFALLLAPFMKLGAPWALNPLLSACTLLVIRHLARRLSSDPLAPGWAVLLTLASPVFTVNAISYYSSAAHLLINLLFMALLLQRSAPRMVLAGVLGSLALTLHHPVAHGLFALPWLIWLLWRRELKHLGALLMGYLPLALTLGYGWIKVRGVLGAENAALAPALAAAPASTSVIQELQAFLGVLRAPDADLLAVRLLGFFKLFLWAVPGLPILALLGFPRLRGQPAARLLGWSALVTLVFFFFVAFSQGHGWGYRYFHPAWAVLPLFGAAALAPSCGQPPSWRKVVGVLALLSLTFGTAVRFEQVQRFIHLHRAQVATAEGAARQVRFAELRGGYYVQDLIQNDPFLRGPTWTFLSFGREADEALIRAYFPGARLAVDRGRSTAWIVEQTARDGPQPAAVTEHGAQPQEERRSLP